MFFAFFSTQGITRLPKLAPDKSLRCSWRFLGWRRDLSFPIQKSPPTPSQTSGKKTLSKFRFVEIFWIATSVESASSEKVGPQKSFHQRRESGSGHFCSTKTSSSCNFWALMLLIGAWDSVLTQVCTRRAVDVLWRVFTRSRCRRCAPWLIFGRFFVHFAGSFSSPCFLSLRSCYSLSSFSLMVFDLFGLFKTFDGEMDLFPMQGIGIPRVSNDG